MVFREWQCGWWLLKSLIPSLCPLIQHHSRNCQNWKDISSLCHFENHFALLEDINLHLQDDPPTTYTGLHKFRQELEDIENRRRRNNISITYTLLFAFLRNVRGRVCLFLCNITYLNKLETDGAHKTRIRRSARRMEALYSTCCWVYHDCGCLGQIFMITSKLWEARVSSSSLANYIRQPRSISATTTVPEKLLLS